MKAALHTLLPAAAAALMLAGCAKADKSAITGGGKGGNAVITVSPEHHGSFVDTCTVYIKYGTNDAPANGLYDDSAQCVMRDTTPVALFTGMKVGQYYLYGVGYHGAYNPPTVKGGTPCTVQKEDTVNVYLPTYQYQ